MACRFWQRWYHRRLRRIDKTILFRTIEGIAINRVASPGMAASAIKYHKSMEPHWQCECALAATEKKGD